MHHVHYDLIVAWAKGAKIEFWNDSKDRWENSSTPQWEVSSLYRIKPEPKPDVVGYCCLDIDSDNKITAMSNFFSKNAEGCNNLMVVFDGETGKLKDVQVLASSAE